MVVKMNKTIKWLMVSFITLVIIDMGLSYYGVKHLGMTETSLIINWAGLTAGIGIVTAMLFFVGWILWKVKNSRLGKVISLSGLSLLCVIELVALSCNFYNMAHF